MNARSRLDEYGSAISRGDLINYSPVLKRMLGANENYLDLQPLMHNRKSIVVNLSRIRDSAAKKLLGSLILYAFEIGAMGRPAGVNKPRHYLIVDEFPEFVGDDSQSLITMLERARQKGLFLTMAHQTLAQANDRFVSALQSAAVKVYFAVVYNDALKLAGPLLHFDPLRVLNPLDGKNHPMSANDQEREWVGLIHNLPSRVAFIRQGKAFTKRLFTINVPSPTLDLAPVKQWVFENSYKRTNEPPPSPPDTLTQPRR